MRSAQKLAPVDTFPYLIGIAWTISFPAVEGYRLVLLACKYAHVPTVFFRHYWVDDDGNEVVDLQQGPMSEISGRKCLQNLKPGRKLPDLGLANDWLGLIENHLSSSLRKTDSFAKLSRAFLGAIEMKLPENSACNELISFKCCYASDATAWNKKHSNS